MISTEIYSGLNYQLKNVSRTYWHWAYCNLNRAISLLRIVLKRTENFRGFAALNCSCVWFLFVFCVCVYYLSFICAAVKGGLPWCVRDDLQLGVRWRRESSFQLMLRLPDATASARRYLLCLVWKQPVWCVCMGAFLLLLFYFFDSCWFITCIHTTT